MKIQISSIYFFTIGQALLRIYLCIISKYSYYETGVKEIKKIDIFFKKKFIFIIDIST